jgi:hypothetical protein
MQVLPNFSQLSPCFQFPCIFVSGPIHGTRPAWYNQTKGGDRMTRVELTAKELTMLTELLESSLSELRTEIAHTDNRDYRLGLKEREKFLEDFLKRLASSAAEV